MARAATRAGSRGNGNGEGSSHKVNECSVAANDSTSQHDMYQNPVGQSIGDPALSSMISSALDPTSFGPLAGRGVPQSGTFGHGDPSMATSALPLPSAATAPFPYSHSDHDAHRLARDLEDFIERGAGGATKDTDSHGGSTRSGFGGIPPSEETIVELQIQTARRLRQLLPTNRDLLHLVQERNWIPLLLGWLNLHDRPAVQVEALLALTSIAELCAQNNFSGASSYSGGGGSGKYLGSAQVSGPHAASNLGSICVYPPGSVPTQVPTYIPSSNLQQQPTSAYSAAGPPFGGFASSGADVMGALGSYMTGGSTSSTPMASASDASKSQHINYYDVAQQSAVSAQMHQASLGNSSEGTPPAFSLSSLPPFTPDPNVAPHPSSVPIADPSTSASMFTSSVVGASGIPQPLSPSSQHLLLKHADAIPTLISLLASPNREVHEHAMWILGSIAAGESSSGSGGNPSGSSTGASSTDKSSTMAARDMVLASGVMTPLLRCLESNSHNLSLQRIGSWTLSNLIEGQFQQSNSKSGSGSGKAGSASDYSCRDEIDIRMLLPTLRRLLHLADAEVLSYTCWTLSHLCDGPSSHIAAVVTALDPTDVPGGLVPRLVELLRHLNWRVTKPALRTIGNIVCAECGEENNSIGGPPADYTEVILDCAAVPQLKNLITHGNREIQKEACWTLSNIAAGTVEQIQAVIDSGAIKPLVKLVDDPSTDQEVRSEACWVVLNATSCGSDYQIEILVDEGCVSVLGVLLGEPTMVMMALEGLERVLQVEEGREMTRRARNINVEAGATLGTDVSNGDGAATRLVSASLIEKALEHNSPAVSKRAGRIWEQHFVSCALCHQSFSRHRLADASFCNECKCHVCSNCDCQIYHLSYQEELWKATEEKNEQSKKAKKNKKAKKKEKRKERKAKQQQHVSAKTGVAASSSQGQSGKQQEPKDSRSRASTVTSSSDSGSALRAAEFGSTIVRTPPVSEFAVVSSTSNKKKRKETATVRGKTHVASVKNSDGQSSAIADSDAMDGPPDANRKGKVRGSVVSPSPPATDDEDEDDDEADEQGDEDDDHREISGNQQAGAGSIDFVLYLQQTGSIIALAKLMDALDSEGGDLVADDPEMDAAELQTILSQQ